MRYSNEGGYLSGKKGACEPDYLYKYGRFGKHTKGIFAQNQIYFSCPEEFNDPFDSKVRYTYEGTRQERKRFLCGRLKKMLKSESKKQIFRRVKEIMRERKDVKELEQVLKETTNRIRRALGIFSLTEKRDNILMWAHYAENHEGFCLEFDANNAFFQKALPVNYSTRLPVLNVMQAHPPLEEAEKLLTKAKDWKYEGEWRIVDHKKGPGTQNFPEEALTGVIIGCRMCRDNREKIIKWCGDRKYRPKIYEAREKEAEFGLDIVEVDY